MAETPSAPRPARGYVSRRAAIAAFIWGIALGEAIGIGIFLTFGRHS